MKTFILKLEEKDVEIVLMSGDEALGTDTWVDNNDLLEQFFPRFDSLLKSHGLSVKNIDKFEIKTENPTGYTTTRIAETIINTLTFAGKYGK